MLSSAFGTTHADQSLGLRCVNRQGVAVLVNARGAGATVTAFTASAATAAAATAFTAALTAAFVPIPAFHAFTAFLASISIGNRLTSAFARGFTVAITVAVAVATLTIALAVTRAALAVAPTESYPPATHGANP